MESTDYNPEREWLSMDLSQVQKAKLLGDETGWHIHIASLKQFTKCSNSQVGTLTSSNLRLHYRIRIVGDVVRHSLN